jgi:hypothetical protein
VDDDATPSVAVDDDRLVALVRSMDVDKSGVVAARVMFAVASVDIDMVEVRLADLVSTGRLRARIVGHPFYSPPQLLYSAPD